jgi:hypothetical protein
MDDFANLYFLANNHQYPRHPSAQLRRQQSGSYSPYVPSAAADHDEPYNDHRPINTSASNPQHETPATPQDSGKGPQNAADFPVQTTPRSNGYYNAPGGTKDTQSKPSIGNSTSGLAPSLGNGKVAESRKKAEAAILNLLPYDVRYQTYIEEGFREDIVGRLFDGLKMPRSSAKSTNTIPAQPPLDQKSQISTAGVSIDQHATPQLANERRKEVSEQITLVTSEPHVQQTQPTAPVPKSAAMTEKERTLQSKMDALRKSREERTKKQAAAKDAKPTAKSAPIPVAAPTPVVKAPTPEIVVPVKPTTSTSDSFPASSFTPKPQPQIASNLIPSKSPAPTIVPQLRQQPSIPGLFLASSGIPGLQFSGSSTPSSSTPSVQRKRPVAADFDDPIPAMTPFKRPFGHHRNDRPLVINVSEDEGESEDEDVAMDLDSVGDQDSPVQSERKMSNHRPAVPQTSAQISQKVNKPFTPPPFPPASNTPPLPSSLSQAIRSSPAALEISIKELKRQIAEKEAKKRAKQTPSRARTPRLPEESSEPKDASTTHGNVSKVDSATQMQQIVTAAQNQVNTDQQKLINAQVAEAEKAAEVSKNELEQKRLLREKIAANQSLVDAEVLQSRSKLEELRAAMAEAEAAYEKSLEVKQRLKEEAERLEQEAELQAKKDTLEVLTSQRPLSSTGTLIFLNSLLGWLFYVVFNALS